MHVRYMAVTEMEQLVSDSVNQTDSDGLILKLLMVYQKILTKVFWQASCGLVIAEDRPKIHQFSAPKLVWIVVQCLTSVQIHQLQTDFD